MGIRFTSRLTRGKLTDGYSFRIEQLTENVVMAYAFQLPRSLTTADRRSVEIHISDVRGEEEKGRIHALYRYCPESYISDGFVPPNLDFQNCFLHNNTTAITPGGPSLRKMINSKATAVASRKGPAEVVEGVVLTKGNLFHAISRHSVMASPVNFPTYRKKPFFKTVQLETSRPGNSVFISVSMVEALVKSTIISPDKVTCVKNGNIAYERGFKTEIGHNVWGCCHITRVILTPCTSLSRVKEGIKFDFVTAFPAQNFLPSI